MKQIIEKINKSWHSNPPCDQQIMLSVGKLFPLPDDYKEFMLWSNGGEGNIGSQYLSLWKIEDLMQLNKEYQIQKYLSEKSLVIGTDGGDNCIGFYFGEPTFIFLQPLGDLDLSENRFLSQSFTDMFINWLRIYRQISSGFITSGSTSQKGRLATKHYLPIKRMNMKIELENCQKSLTLKDFEEIESKLGYALPERLKEFYLQYNGGEPKQQTISINKYYEVEIRIFQPFKYNKSFKNALFHTVEGETLEHRSSNSISDNILLFASGHNNLRNIGVIAINIKNRAVYFYKIIGFVKNSDAFIFDEPQLIADSIDDFFNNLVAFPKIEEEQQTEIIEIEGVMPELSDCSASLTKEDIKNFEVELNVKIPAGMKNFYLKFNGGMPSPYCFQPQDEDLDWVEINAFFPIKERTNAFETIEVIAKDMWSRNLMPSNLLPFAMDSGGNYYALNLKNKKIYYYLTDEWDENASREYNFETNTRYIAQSFNYFINHFIEEEE